MCYYYWYTRLVYDSGCTKWDEETLCLLKKQFHCSPSNICVPKDVQKQQGGKECGSLMPQVLHLEKTLVRRVTVNRNAGTPSSVFF